MVFSMDYLFGLFRPYRTYRNCWTFAVVDENTGKAARLALVTINCNIARQYLVSSI